MCLILDKAPDVAPIPPGVLRRAARENPDGWGVVATLGRRTRVTRGFAVDALVRAVDRATAEGAHVTVHCRWATHGPRTVENTHPVVIVAGGRRYYVVHNGVCRVSTAAAPHRTDTWHYAHGSIAPALALGGLDALESLDGDPALGWSRIVVIGEGGRRTHVGGRGVYLPSGVWASNDSPLGWSDDGGDLTPRDDDADADGGLAGWESWLRRHAWRDADPEPEPIEDFDADRFDAWERAWYGGRP